MKKGKKKDLIVSGSQGIVDYLFKHNLADKNAEVVKSVKDPNRLTGRRVFQLNNLALLYEGQPKEVVLVIVDQKKLGKPLKDAEWYEIAKTNPKIEYLKIQDLGRKRKMSEFYKSPA